MVKKSFPAVTAFVFFIIMIIIGSCSNPAIIKLMDQVETDVAVSLAGDSPAIKSVVPGNSAESVSTSVMLTAVFDLALDPESVTSETVKLTRISNETQIDAAVIYNSETKTVTVSPAAVLEKETEYRLTITTGLKSLKGAALAVDFTIDFTTRYFHDTEIGIDFTYFSNDLILDAGAPIYMEVWSAPLQYPVNPDDMPVLTSNVITESGKIAISQSEITAGTTAGLFKFFHDLNGSYGVDSDSGDSEDSNSWYSSEGSGNLVSEDDFNDSVIVADPDSGSFYIDADGSVVTMTDNMPDSLPAFYNLNPDFIMSVGNGYTVLYTDGSPVAADPYEAAEALNNYRNIEHGTYEDARNLHALDDIDYFTFTPATSDMYEIRIGDTSLDIQVGLYATESNMFTETSPLAPPGGGDVDGVINSGGTFLSGGTEYYLRVESLTGGLGVYKLGYFYKPAAADPFEDVDDDWGTAPVINFGRDNAVSRTIEAGWDSDYFALTIENGLDYIVEVTEDPTYFHPSAESRNIEFDLSFKKSDGSGAGTYGLDTNTMIIKASDDWNYPAGTYYIGVDNNSTGIGLEQDQPSGRYQILVTYSFDGSDSADNPQTDPLDEYNEYNEHGPASYDASSYVYEGKRGIERTIYSTTESDPGDDVDWIRFQVFDVQTEYIIKTEPVSGEDGITVDFEIYNSLWNGSSQEPDLTDTGDGPFIAGSSQNWTDDSIRGTVVKKSYTADPDSTYRTFWAKVFRDDGHSGNPETGAYKFYFMAGADWQDDNNPDYELDIYSGTTGSPGSLIYTGGIDETPWIYKTHSNSAGDFSDRNELSWEGLAGDPQTVMHNRTLYKKDYSAAGENDGGAVDESSDFDFFWTQIPTQMTSYPFSMNVHQNSKYAFPVKVTIWHVTEAEWISYSADRVITEAELGAAQESHTSSFNAPSNDEELYINKVEGISNPDYVVFKFEVDTSRVGTSYVDQAGDTQYYENTGEYRFSIRRNVSP